MDQEVKDEHVAGEHVLNRSEICINLDLDREIMEQAILYGSENCGLKSPEWGDRV